MIEGDTDCMIVEFIGGLLAGSIEGLLEGVMGGGVVDIGKDCTFL